MLWLEPLRRWARFTRRSLRDWSWVMSSTVTTTTVTTINSVSIAGAFALVIILWLIGFVIAKEIIEGSVGNQGDRTYQWGKALKLGVVPLAVSFAMIAAISLAGGHG
jgi:hypothetical protein